MQREEFVDADSDMGSISVNRWLAVRLEFVGATIIFITAVLSIVALVTTGVDAGLVGFVLSYALNTTGSLVSCTSSALNVCSLTLCFVELASAFG